MVPRGGDLENSLRSGLTANLGKVWAASVLRSRARPDRRQGAKTGDVLDGLGERGDGNDIDARECGGLICALCRHQQLAQSELARETGNCQAASYRSQSAVESQLATDEKVFERVGGQLFVGGKQGQGDRQVEMTALLAKVRGSEIDQHSAWRQLEAAVTNRRCDSFLAFPHGGIG